MMNLLGYIAKAASAAFDTLLPLRAHSARTKERTLCDLHVYPEEHCLLGLTITTILTYKDPAVRDAILALKFEGSHHAARLLADALADYLSEEIASLRTMSARHVWLVPIPLHTERRRERGFNQTEVICSFLPDELKEGLARIVPDALMRARDTKRQTSLTRSERLSNVAGAFMAKDGFDMRGVHAIVIDDVTTTGATLVNAGNALRRAGATVTLIALARA